MGQRVKEFAIEARIGDRWQSLANGTTIGYKQIIPLGDGVTTNELRIRFIDSRGPLAIARIAVY